MWSLYLDSQEGATIYKAKILLWSAICNVKKNVFEKMGQLGLFFVYFRSFLKNINTILQQINVKNVHPVCGIEIWTHDLQIVSLLSQPLDQGSLLISCILKPCIFYLFSINKPIFVLSHRFSSVLFPLELEKRVWMACSGREPRAAGWKAKTTHWAIQLHFVK